LGLRHGGLEATFCLTRLVGQLESFKALAERVAYRWGLPNSEVSLPVASNSKLLFSLLAGMLVEHGGLGHGLGVFGQYDGQRVERTGYRPISEEVGNQRRLRVTKGVSLPSDIPMHGFFGSKDVIHSWAIPGLAVKIDCIPGYGSHRRVILH
jgi:heme/copper-type cytochrome/quinol oxidase subunit 2